MDAGRDASERGKAPEITVNQGEYDLLRISEIRYRRLFEAAQDGVLLVDPLTRKIADANPFMTRLLGYSHAGLVGKEVFEIGLLKDERASQEMFVVLRANGMVRYEDLPLESETGVHHEVEVVANVYDEGGHSIIQFNIRDITVRKQREAHNALLLAEVNHRARNLLAVVQVIAQQTTRHSDQASFVTRLTERIRGLAASQDLLVDSAWRGVGLRELVGSQLAHFKDLMGTRVRFEGSPLRLTPAAAQAIGMAVHEMGTNAGKYGALSNGNGRVTISSGLSADGSMFTLSWVEENGPPVVAPTHSGFGRKVIESMVELAVDGTTEIVYAPVAFPGSSRRRPPKFWRLHMPTARTQCHDRCDRTASADCRGRAIDRAQSRRADGGCWLSRFRNSRAIAQCDGHDQARCL